MRHLPDSAYPQGGCVCTDALGLCLQAVGFVKGVEFPSRYRRDCSVFWLTSSQSWAIPKLSILPVTGAVVRGGKQTGYWEKAQGPQSQRLGSKNFLVFPQTLCLETVVVSMCACVHAQSGRVAHQVPLFMEFCRQEFWSGLPLSSPGALPNPVIKPASALSPALAGGFFPTSTTWESGGLCMCSVQFSRSVMSDSLWPHGLQYDRLPCPSPNPGAYLNSCPSSW